MKLHIEQLAKIRIKKHRAKMRRKRLAAGWVPKPKPKLKRKPRTPSKSKLTQADVAILKARWHRLPEKK